MFTTCLIKLGVKTAFANTQSGIITKQSLVILEENCQNVGDRPYACRPLGPKMQTANLERDDNVQNLPRVFGGRYHGDRMSAHFLQILHCQASGGLQCVSRVRRCHSPVSPSGLYCL